MPTLLKFSFLLIYYWSINDEVVAYNRTIRQTLCGDRFECATGECIDRDDVCNGLFHCKDGSDEFPTACGCGQRTEIARTNSNAPGVQNAVAGANPWHAGIYIITRQTVVYKHLCSGTLIYSDIVLTSASCLVEPDTGLTYLTSALLVGLGKLKKDYGVDETHQQKFEAREVIVLDYYDGNFKYYHRNLAIIQLKRPISKSYYVRPACLWSSKNLPPGITTGTIVGWGLQYKGNYAIDLREATVRLLDIKTCRRTFDSAYQRYLTMDKMCIDFEEGVGLREQDVGGPVTVYYQERHYLVGIISQQFDTNHGLATYLNKHINWIRNTTSVLKKAESCLRSSHFNCIADSQCIKVEKLCDDTKDCSDGSDEDPVRCAVKQSNRPKGKSCSIPENNDVFTPYTCSDPNGCKSPYSAPTQSVYLITCPDGYGFAGEDTSVRVVCTDGIWTPSLENNKCLKLCPPQSHKSLELHCMYQGSTVRCDVMLKPNTKILIDCKKQYKKIKTVNYVSETYCKRDGSILNDYAECAPVCGEVFDSSRVKPLISKGEELKYAKYPWHTALYWKSDDVTSGIPYDYKCGGTLIDSDKILTAAHCVWLNKEGRMINPDRIAVVLGKLHSNWLIRDDWEQRRQVLRIITGKHYNGAKSKHSNDIAVLILKTEVELSDSIMPACLDLDRTAGGIPRDQAGLVVGWGSVSDEETDPSPILKETTMDYMDLDTCRSNFEKRFGFTDYLHADKFCALYRNGSGSQGGDSGGSMTFKHDGLYYVYGIVSVKRVGQDVFSVFTNVIQHSAWLSEILQT